MDAELDPALDPGLDPGLDLGRTDLALMLHGETRHCTDCRAATIFLPVEQHGWICTSCDAAVVLVDPAHAWASAA